MAAVFHILYRLLFQEIDGFLQSSGHPQAVSSALASVLLLALAFPVYHWLLSDTRKPADVWSASVATLANRSASVLADRSTTVWTALAMALLAGLLAGCLVLVVAFFWSDSPSPLPGVVGVFLIVILTPAAEELYFRYLMQGYLMESLKRVSASAPMIRVLPLAFSVLCFAFSHHYFIAPVLLIPGLASGLVFLRWGVLASMVTHSAYNAVLIGGAYAFS
ncbi:MAG: CPBP family intramembrane metalloprotease [Leptospiraceae bacterium]|nr:CPBP family intramembrane metalloprotease [Leptospiraceae bacterium]MCB1171179.1 CPBP family intramembrane metalloprotease [Leptospiraceae bacterium]